MASFHDTKLCYLCGGERLDFSSRSDFDVFWGELNCNVLLREAYECLPNCIDFFEEHCNICISDWFNERLLIKFLNLKIKDIISLSLEPHKPFLGKLTHHLQMSWHSPPPLNHS